MTRSMVDLLLILSICETSRLTQRSVLAAGETVSPYSVSDSVSKSSSTSSTSKKDPLNLSVLPLENHLSSDDDRSVQNLKKGAGSGHRNGDWLRAVRGKRGAMPRFVYDCAHLGDPGLPSEDILVYPREASGDNFYHHEDDSAADRANSRDYSESPKDIFGKESSLTTIFSSGKKFPDLSLTRSMRRPESQRLTDEKRKWKSKNMALWGR